MCICWCVTEISYKMHGSTIKIQRQKIKSLRHIPPSKPYRIEHSVSVIKTLQTVLCRDIRAVRSEIITCKKRINILCWQKVRVVRNNLEALVVASTQSGLD